jgi:TRAP-type C4-dicarboxylate transport system substrate-binding protein/esterase/lipase superfamily enzyme
MRLIALSALVSVISIFVIDNVFAQQNQNTIRLAVAKHFDPSTARFVEIFQKEAKKYDIEIVPTDAFSTRDAFSALKSGDSPIDLALISFQDIPSVQFDPKLVYTSLFVQPGLIASPEESFALQDSFIGDVVATEMVNAGLSVVAFLNRPPEAIILTRKLDNIADLQGAKFRGGSEASNQLLAELGANPVQLPMGEVFVALERGAVDAAETNAAFPAADALQSVGQSGTIINNFRQNPGFLLARREVWLGFSQRLRSVIEESADMARQASQRVVSENNDNLNKLALGLDANYKSVGDEGWEGIEPAAAKVWLAVDASDDRNSAYENLKSAKNEIQVRRSRGGSVAPKSGMPAILFATNRNEENTNNLEHRFGQIRNSSNSLKCGRIVFDKNVPRNFGKVFPGQIELAGQLAVGQSDCVEYLSQFAGSNRRVILYFHGFNNTFKNAVTRAIGFTMDFGLREPVLVWSWPSLGGRGGSGEYVGDLNGVDFTNSYIKDFVDSLAEADLIEEVSIVAHSMGTKIAGQFIRHASEKNLKIANVIFVAPDYPKSTFEQLINEAGAAALLKTVYANRHDRALGYSRAQSKEHPVGLGGDLLELVQGVETVDVSKVAVWGIDNHAHGFDVREVANDISRLVIDRSNADGRALPQAEKDGVRYWRIEAD